MLLGAQGQRFEPFVEQLRLVSLETIANDCIFGIMRVTILKDKH